MEGKDTKTLMEGEGDVPRDSGDQGRGGGADDSWALDALPQEVLEMVLKRTSRRDRIGVSHSGRTLLGRSETGLEVLESVLLSETWDLLEKEGVPRSCTSGARGLALRMSDEELGRKLVGPLLRSCFARHAPRMGRVIPDGGEGSSRATSYEFQVMRAGGVTLVDLWARTEVSFPPPRVPSHSTSREHVGTATLSPDPEGPSRSLGWRHSVGSNTGGSSKPVEDFASSLIASRCALSVISSVLGISYFPSTVTGSPSQGGGDGVAPDVRKD